MSTKYRQKTFQKNVSKTSIKHLQKCLLNVYKILPKDVPEKCLYNIFKIFPKIFSKMFHRNVSKTSIKHLSNVFSMSTKYHQKMFQKNVSKTSIKHFQKCLLNVYKISPKDVPEKCL